ncbi:MAG: chromate transporter [Muribaculaceae bacterium]|nr:chromate transporter [Muribaculaceae bacterium]
MSNIEKFEEKEVEREESNLCLKLFLSFMKIGAFTFGGGWAMISIIEREIVDKHHWIKREDFLDLLAVAQSLPGILAVNIATAIGDSLRKGKGAVIAALGTILPSFIIILAIAIFLTPETIKNNHVISSIFMGIRPAVVALIVAPVISSAKAAKIRLNTIWIPAIVALMISLDIGFLSNPILYIVLGAAGGYLYFRHTHKSIRKEDGNA